MIHVFIINGTCIIHDTVKIVRHEEATCALFATLLKLFFWLILNKDDRGSAYIELITEPYRLYGDSANSMLWLELGLPDQFKPQQIRYNTTVLIT